MEKRRKKILFICTHNSARSQMAEGLVNFFHRDNWEAYSAGTEAAGVKPLAVKAMAEIGIDISHHRSKTVEEFMGKPFDLAVTVCDNAKANCPFFPGALEYIHKSFEDPSAARGTEGEKIAVFRRVRDEIKEWIDQTME